MSVSRQIQRGASRPTMLCLLLAAVGAAGCNVVVTTAPLFDRDQTISVDHAPGTALDVLTSNGSIKVTKSDRADVEIAAHLKAESQERVDAAQIVTQRGDDKTLSVRVEWPDGKPHRGDACSFEILIPDAVGIKLESVNGALHAAGLAGPANLQTSNGSIEVEKHAGPIDARTVNGSVDVSGASEAVEATTTNGAVSIALAVASAGPIEAHVTNGTIDILVGPAFAGDMSAETINGKVVVDKSVGARRVDNQPRHAQLAFASAGKPSSVSTVNGNVHVGSIAEAKADPTIQAELNQP